MSPVIVPSADLTALRAAGTDPTASARAHEALDQACQEHGFFLLTGHGLDAVFDRMWHASAEFFGSERANKLSVLRSETQALGYYDRELTKRKRDLKEVFDYTEPRRPGERDPNQWPAQPPGFQDTLAEFYGATGSLALELLTLLGRTLAFGAARSAGAGAREALAAAPLTMPAGSPRHSNVRLNHYPNNRPAGGAGARANTRAR
ncbi:MAG: 2-oxoglutarate and iron-dependent oxygenase domain-containing protein [Pseudomonadota bacterium]